MLINHMRERSYALEDGIDSSLHEWSDNRLPPLRLGVQNNQDEGRHITLPSISPYSMDFFPQYEIQTGVQNNQDEGQQITLPSISPYSMDCFPQYEIQTGAHPHEVRAYVSADPALDLRYQSANGNSLQMRDMSLSKFSKVLKKIRPKNSPQPTRVILKSPRLIKTYNCHRSSSRAVAHHQPNTTLNSPSTVLR